MIDTKALLGQVKILDLIQADIGRPIKRSGKYYFFKCPFHSEATPSFAVTPDNGVYYCFGCGATGDAISWLMEYRHLSFVDACDILSSGKPIKSKWLPTVSSPTDKESQAPLPDSLQEQWRTIVEHCQKTLYTADGEKALSYLYKRGIKDKIIQSSFFKIGYSRGEEIAGIFVNRGIIIPCIDSDYIHYVKIRLPQSKPKYIQLDANGYDISGVYNASLSKGADIVFVTEGEFDCMLLQQEAGEFVGSVTLGSSTQRFDKERHSIVFETSKHVVVCLDNDEAGRKGEQKWREREFLPCFSRKMVYTSVPEPHKDITDFYVAGGKLVDWVFDTLKPYNFDAE